MAGRGPAPTPTAILRQRGSTLLRHRTDEPMPDRGCPQCPKELDAEARREWHRTIIPWAKRGVIRKLNRATAAAYCMAWSRLLEARQHVKEEGAVMTTDRGFPVKNPWITIEHESTTRLLRFAQELGLTPASQTRVRAEKEKNADAGNEKARFFRPKIAG